MVGLLALVAVGCGEDDSGDAGAGATNAEEATAPVAQETAPAEQEPAPAEAEEAPAQDETTKGTTVVLGESEFGEMLYDADDQAIYVFEQDKPEESVCYGECAAAWPPVISAGEPVAGKGVNASLLGTAKRRDGSLQVTYAGKPLYYYAHEAPGEVRCHNIDLNGGFWWVVGADGEPLA